MDGGWMGEEEALGGAAPAGLDIRTQEEGVD